MKKVIIIGCPGSGKSTFARALREKTKLPLHYLDMLYWNPDKTTVEKDIFLRKLNELLRQDAWILDGNFKSTLELRLQYCDTVIFLDYPVDICLEGIRERRGKARPDLPWIETEDDPEFLEFIRNFQTQVRPRMMELLAQNENKNIHIFKNRQETAAFLETITR